MEPYADIAYVFEVVPPREHFATAALRAAWALERLRLRRSIGEVHGPEGADCAWVLGAAAAAVGNLTAMIQVDADIQHELLGPWAVWVCHQNKHLQPMLRQFGRFE